MHIGLNIFHIYFLTLIHIISIAFSNSNARLSTDLQSGCKCRSQVRFVRYRGRSKLRYLMRIQRFQRAAKLAMALHTDKWLRKDPSDHISSMSLSVVGVGGRSRSCSVCALGCHVGRFVGTDLCVSDCERGSLAECRRSGGCVK